MKGAGVTLAGGTVTVATVEGAGADGSSVGEVWRSAPACSPGADHDGDVRRGAGHGSEETTSISSEAQETTVADEGEDDETIIQAEEET